MSTSVDELGEWFDEGVRQGATHMVVAVDTFSHEDFPVYVKPSQDVQEVVAKYTDAEQFLRVMEVYSLTGDRASQLAPGTRVWNVA